MLRRAALAAICASVLAVPAFAADAPPAPVREILQRGPVSGAPTQELIVAAVTFPKGGLLAFHTHPGEEAGVVVSGRLTIEVAGQPTLTLGPGQGYLLPRGVRHQASSPDGETRVAATYVVDKGQPLATPAP
jgi:quercetin dioxygenase-like cupin family protein